MSTPAWNLATFVSLSSALTGVDASQLKPQVDPIGIAQSYFDVLAKSASASDLSKLALLFQSNSDPVQAASTVLSDPEVGNLARSILKLWLLGAWYDPKSPTEAVSVVSAQAYKESLVWKVMQSHPMGYSMFTFGYWSKPPPPLDQFIQPVTSANLSPTSNP